LTVAIVTDSTADLPAQLAADHGISVVPLTINLDGHSYLDGVEISPADFYERLPRALNHPTTSQPSPGQFKALYEALLADHEHILSVHISHRLSGTISSAEQAAAIVDRERIHVLDSEFVSMPLAALALVAARAAERGSAVDEIVDDVKRVRTALRCYFAVATLEYLRRGGRIGTANAFLGSMLQIKPILSIEGGQVTPLERVRTHERALARLTDLGQTVDRGAGLCLVVGHAAAETAALAVAERLEGVAESLIVLPMGPVVGAHAGPGTVGLAAYPAELFPLGLSRRIAAQAAG